MNAESLIALGTDARKRQDYAAALTHFMDAAAAQPANLKPQIEIADILRRLKRLPEAAACCDDVLKAAPHNGRAMFVRGLIARDDEKHAEALGHFEQASVRQPQHLPYRHEIAQTLRDLGRLDEAQHCYREILAQDPANVRAANALAGILRQLGDLEGALAELKFVNERIPFNEPMHLEMGRLFTQLKRYEEASAAFHRVLEFSPHCVAAMLGLGEVARGAMDLPLALAHFRRAAEEDPNDANLGIEIAAVLFELQRPDEAEAIIRRYEEGPAANRNAAYQLRKLRYYCQTLQLDNAEDALRFWPSCRDFPDGSLGLIAKFYAERERWDAIADLLKERITRSGWPTSSQSCATLLEAVATAARRMGKYGEIFALVERVPGSDSNPVVRDFQDQIVEEFLLLNALGLADGFADGTPQFSGDSRVGSERHALRARILDTASGIWSATQLPTAASPANPLRADPQNKNVIYYCTDTKYLLGAAVSLFSLLRHNPGIACLADLVVHCPPEVVDFASTVFNAISEAFQTSILVSDTQGLIPQGLQFRTTWGGLTGGTTLSDAAYYRIYAALRLINEKRYTRALYIDSDTCVGAGVERLLKFDLRGQPMGARPEPMTVPAAIRATARLKLELGTYFNSGVMLFDLSHDELESKLAHAIEISLTQQHLLICLDQCALNLAFVNRTAVLPAEANTFVRAREDHIHGPEQPVVMHFLAHPKPWDPWYRNSRWRSWFDEAMPLFEMLGPEQSRRLLRSHFELAIGR